MTQEEKRGRIGLPDGMLDVLAERVPTRSAPPEAVCLEIDIDLRRNEQQINDRGCRFEGSHRHLVELVRYPHSA